MRISPLAALVLLGCQSAQPTATPAAGDVFPYRYHTDDFDNGLRLLTIPTEHPGVVSLYIIVSVGSRDEIEEGRSGFAHFFEHMMFRGSENFTAAEQAALFKRAGADRNAYTTDDYTCYHATFSPSDLEAVLEVEADRFQRLKYAEPEFRTEAMAIRGEYNTSSASPVVKMFEAVRDEAFDRHTYEHTTLGFLRDISAMPRMYDYSLEFFRRHYRPDNTTILIVGDVEPGAARRTVAEHWGDWQASGGETEPPAPEPPQTAPRSLHVNWPAPTRPWVMVSFKGPAFSTTEKDMAVLDVISSVAFSEHSELYEKLFLREGRVDVLAADFGDHVDPYLVSVIARVSGPEHVDPVRREILATCARLATEPIADDVVARAVRNLRYSFAAALDSPDGIGQSLAGYVARGRSPDAANRVFRMYEQVTPEDIQEIAAKYLVSAGRTVATLSHEALPEPVVEEPVETPTVPVEMVLQPTGSPLVSIRVVFRVGSTVDPVGKEGLAYVTARLLANGGTRHQSYAEITEQLFPMAAEIEFQVDKEMTVFHGTVHRDNVEDFCSVLRSVLTEPAFDADDLERVKANTIAFLDDGLRRSDEEELGKEVLYRELYAGHPYRSHSSGAISTVGALDVADVEAFYAEHYAPHWMTLGMSGDYPDDLPARLSQGLARGLPPAASTDPIEIPAPPDLDRNRMTIVQKKMTGTGIHVGYPIEVNRSHPDWPALWLIRSYFGEHRSDNSYLYQRLREVRGLNYGDYAYIEYFPRGPSQFRPDPNLARQSQIFQIWIRPVVPTNGPFALHATLYELRKLVENGMSEEAFEATRTYLSKSASMLVQSQDRRLGYAIDSRYYGTGEFAPWIAEELEALTLEDVNRALRRHLRADRMQIVVVTEDAEAFRDAVLSGAVEPPRYASSPSDDVVAEDREITALRVALRPEDVQIVPVEDVFR